MPNIIELNLLSNKSIVATMQGIPLANENSYKIIAGEENSTVFIIKSLPTQYENARLTVEMVNAKGYGIEETDIGKVEVDTVSYKGFNLPVGMAVAGYGYVSIKAYIGTEKAPFQPLKLKVWNTLPNWKDGVSSSPNGTSIIVDTVLSSTSTNPVQNKVITNAINELDGRIDSLESSSGESGGGGLTEQDLSNYLTTYDYASYGDRFNFEVQTAIESVGISQATIAKAGGIVEGGSAWGMLTDDVETLKTDVEQLKSGGGSAIIDVEELPTENINTKALYRVNVVRYKADVVYWGELNYTEFVPAQVIVVDELPTKDIKTYAGGSIIDTFYLRRSDMTVWIYGAYDTTANGQFLFRWENYQELSEKVEAEDGTGFWGGIVSSFDEVTDNTKVYFVYQVINNPRLYSYANNKWEILSPEDEDKQVNDERVSFIVKKRLEKFESEGGGSGLTVDKIDYIDTTHGGHNGGREVSVNEKGIYWTQDFDIDLGDEHHSSTIYQNVPIIAGEGVSLEVEAVDEFFSAVKINATGGGEGGGGLTVDKINYMDKSVTQPIELECTQYGCYWTVENVETELNDGNDYAYFDIVDIFPFRAGKGISIDIVPVNEYDQNSQVFEINATGGGLTELEVDEKIESATQNLATVDKITAIDTGYGSAQIIETDDRGIFWKDTYSIQLNKSLRNEGEISNRIPILAGENITFEPYVNDGEETVLKINATGGTNGKDGVGIKSVVQTTTSSADGGTNVVTVTKTDGSTSTFSVKNGSKGSNGTNGVGITKVEQTKTSTASGGENEITVTLSNGQTSKFKVYNGEKGADGSGGGGGSSSGIYGTKITFAELKENFETYIAQGKILRLVITDLYGIPQYIRQAGVILVAPEPSSSKYVTTGSFCLGGLIESTYTTWDLTMFKENDLYCEVVYFTFKHFFGNPKGEFIEEGHINLDDDNCEFYVI